MEAIQTYAENFVRNLKGSFTRLKPEGWIRLIWIVGAYLLLRPYLMKLGARNQQKQHEEAKAANAPTGAEVHPNELRTGKKGGTGKKVGIATGGKDTKFVTPRIRYVDEGTTDMKAEKRGREARVRSRRAIRESATEKEPEETTRTT